MLFFVGLFVSGCSKRTAAPDDSSLDYTFDSGESTNVKVCVYLDYGVFDVCRANTMTMLNDMHCNYTSINRDSILIGALNHYGVLIMPGGDMWGYRSYLSSTGMDKIREYVNQGGGYIGICGGSYFAADVIVWRGWANQPRDSISINGLDLFPMIADGPIEDYAPSYVDRECPIAIVQKSHPIATNLANVIQPYYDHGPMFLFNDSLDTATLGRTVVGNKRILLAFEYDKGKVFLTGAHPEADDSRVTWVMVKNAIIWCSR